LFSQEIDECGENENENFCMNDGISKELNESITEDEIKNIEKKNYQIVKLVAVIDY
jgi:hypothetical protein